MNKKYLYLIIGVAAVVAIAVAGLVGCQDRGSDMPVESVQTAEPTAEPTAATPAPTKTAQPAKTTQSASTPAPAQPAEPVTAPADPAPVEPAPAPVEPEPAPVEPEPAAPSEPSTPSGPPQDWTKPIEGDGRDYDDIGYENRGEPEEPPVPEDGGF